MTVKNVEKLEKSRVAVTVEVGAEEFEAAVAKAYAKARGKLSIPGFRPGKAPRKMIEKLYGAGVFYSDAVDIALPEAYTQAIGQSGLDVVGYPEIEIVDDKIDENGFTFKATVAVYPEVKLGEYKGLTAEKEEIKVSADDVKERLNEMAERNARLVSVDRKAKKGDIAVIDFEGFDNGVAFEGGKGENFDLELGSGSFVPGFEDQVIGMKAGEEKDIDITFPENYHADLAGKSVVFKVKVHEVKEKEVPALDDEFAKDVSELDTLDELKEQKVEELKDEGFVISNFHSGGVFYTMLMIVLRIKVEVIELLRVVLNNMFVSHAGGAWLDLKMADYSKKRKKAQKTQGFVTVSRTDMTGEAVKIPKGHVFKSILDINGEELRFFVLEAATLQKGASSVDVLVEDETEGSRYNVPAGQIVRTLTYLGDVTFSNAEDWIVREGSDTEDDESARARTLRSWSELAQRATEDTFIDAAESVPGVLFAQADCNHPRGQGTVDVIVTGTAGEATEGLLAAVREAVDKIAGPYDNILVKSSVTVSQNISVTVTTDTADTDEAVENRIKAILTELLAVRRSRKLNELTLSDINHAIRSGYSGATNAAVSEPEADVKLGKDKVIILGDVSVTIERE